jgi:Ca-activated chloride channel family protein
VRRQILLLLALLAAPGGLFAQKAQNTSLTENYSVGYVMVPFTALDGRGRAITDLRQRDVHLDVENVPVRTDLFEKSMNAPVSFTILVDGSGSMALAGKLASARAAVDALLAQRLPGDDYSVYLFTAGEAREVVPFTDDADAIRRAMSGVRPWGKTAFFDALATMPDRSRLGRNPTRAIVLLSDGIDNASTLTREQLGSLLQGVGIPIYPLGLRDRSEEMLLRMNASKEELSDVELLDEVANFTGGRLHLGNEPEQLREAVASIENDLRSQYLIGFSPTGRGAVKYRQISLKLARRVSSVRVRSGYRGTEPPALAE